MLYKPKEHCGVVLCHSLHDTYKALKALQHRGQDTAGIAARTKYGIDVLTWEGLVSDFSLQNIEKILSRGDMFIGHVRYATTGPKDMLLDGAHPRFLDGKITAEYKNKDIPVRHIIARGATKAISHNGTLVGVSPYGGIDTDRMLSLYNESGLEDIIEKLPAAYAAVVLDMQKDEGLAFRDRYEIRPLWIGEKDRRIVAASEDVAIWDIGGRPIREVRGGEVIYINNESIDFESIQVVEPKPKKCFFEWNYNSGQSSALDDRIVSGIRYRVGIELGREFRPENVDMVTYIPHSPKQMARGYSDATHTPFTEVFYKVKMRRAFIDPTPEERADSIKRNLFVLDNLNLRGKRIVVIDDSVVRLNNAPHAARILREKEAEWIALVLGTPVIGECIRDEKRGCIFGVDMPPEDNFAIRKYGSVEGITKASGFDEVYFISMKGIENAHGVPLSQRCTYCIGGPNPVSEEEMDLVKKLNL